MKKKLISLLMGAAMTAITLCGCAPTGASLDGSGPSSGLQSQSESTSYQTLSSATDGTTVNLLSGEVYEFVTNYQIDVAKPHCTRYADGTTKTNPTPAHIAWTDTKEANNYTIKLSRNADMSEAEIYSSLTTSLDVEDLFTGTKYYYQIYAHRDGYTSKSKVFSFTTAHSPRTIKADTTSLDSNLRDIGGYYTEDGKHRVKQGIAYRGAEVKHYTQDAKDKLIYTLGIKTELAVHNKDDYRLSDDIPLILAEGPHYVEWSGIAFYGNGKKEELKKELLVFADADNFPVFFHCQLGRDRTGTLAFLLGALLGVSKQDLFLDYELAYLTQYGGYQWWGENCPETKVFQLEAMYQYLNDGHCINYSNQNLTNAWFDSSATTLADRTAAYLKGCLGITDAEIAAIRANMLEEV